MSMLFVVVAAVCLAGLLPGAIAGGKGRSFLLWWLYGALVFPLALVQAIRLAEDDRERRVPDGQKECPGCGEAVPEAAQTCRYCGEEIAAPASAAGSGAADDPPADWDEGFASLVQEPAPPQPERPSRSSGTAAIMAASVAAVVGFFAIGFVIVNNTDLLSLDELFQGDRERSVAGRAGAIEPSAGSSDRLGEGRSYPDGVEIMRAPPDPEGAPVPTAQDDSSAGEGAGPPVPLPLGREAARPREEGQDAAPTSDRRNDPDNGSVDPRQSAGDLPTRAPQPGRRSDGPGAVTVERLPDAPPREEVGSATLPQPSETEAPRGERETTGRNDPDTRASAPAESGSAAPPRPATRPDPARPDDDEVTAVGDLVLWVQRELFRRGFFNGTIDGRAGRATREAVRAYQRSQDLRPSGEIDPVLVTSLRRAASARPPERLGERQLTQD